VLPEPVVLPVPAVPLVPLVPLVPVDVPVVVVVPVVPTELLVLLPVSPVEAPVLLASSEEVELSELVVGVALVVVSWPPDWLALSSSGRGVRPISPTLTCVFSMLLVPTAVWLVLPFPVVPVDMTLPDPLTEVWLPLPLSMASFVTAVLLLWFEPPILTCGFVILEVPTAV
jgi:signal-induced proliferation-associated 1 like protein 3